MEHVKSIDIFKNVVITDTYTAGESRYGAQDYLNITAKDGDAKNGFVNAVFAFDGSSCCCEDFGTETSYGLYGEHYVTRIHIYESDTSPDGACYGNDYGSMTVVIDVLEPLGPNTRTNKQTEHQWMCYNEHNGYYGHAIDVEVSEDGRKIFEYWNEY